MSIHPYEPVESGGWQVYTPANARAYLRRRGVGLARGHATPFLNDCVSRNVFETVTLDVAREE